MEEWTLLGKGRLINQARIRWAGHDADETSWEEIEHLQRVFLSLNLEDKVGSERDGDDRRRANLSVFD